jgi:hypothetical protein
MPSLEINRQLRLKYDKETKKSIPLFEHLNIKDPDRIEKAISDSAIELLDGDYQKYFVKGEYAPVYLLFIDVCRFSTRFGHFTGKLICQYFDAYYDIVIPIIYQYGGTIDKIMGDGIVVVFGQPFLDVSEDECFNRVDHCARTIITATSTLRNGLFSSKVAIVYGNINYYKNKSLHYQEYTIVGSPLTQLFRLESVAVDESICFYSESNVADFYGAALKWRTNSPFLRDGAGFQDDNKHTWGISKITIKPLPGVPGQDAIFSLEYLK